MPGSASRENGKKGGRPRKDRGTSTPPTDAATQPIDSSQDPPFQLTANPFGLTRREQRFVDDFVISGNASASYRVAYPRCSDATSNTNGPRLLAKAGVVDAITEARKQQWIAKQGDVEEAEARIWNFARGEMGEVAPKGHWVHTLPLEVRQRIKKIREHKYGTDYELYDAMHANEVLLKIRGRMKETVKVENLAEIIAKSWEFSAPKPAEGASA